MDYWYCCGLFCDMLFTSFCPFSANDGGGGTCGICSGTLRLASLDAGTGMGGTFGIRERAKSGAVKPELPPPLPWKSGTDTQVIEFGFIFWPCGFVASGIAGLLRNDDAAKGGGG